MYNVIRRTLESLASVSATFAMEPDIKPDLTAVSLCRIPAILTVLLAEAPREDFELFELMKARGYCGTCADIAFVLELFEGENSQRALWEYLPGVGYVSHHPVKSRFD